jgi:hypothetical protein
MKSANAAVSKTKKDEQTRKAKNRIMFPSRFSHCTHLFWCELHEQQKKIKNYEFPVC